MGRTPNAKKPLEVRERSALLFLLEDERIEWRVSMYRADKSLVEQAFVTAPDFNGAERVAKAFMRGEPASVDMCLCERLTVCAHDGCDTPLAFYDPRYTSRPAHQRRLDCQEALEGRRWCIKHLPPATTSSKARPRKER